MKHALIVAALFTSTTLQAAVVAETRDGIAVATPGQITLYDAAGTRRWSTAGPDFAGSIVSEDGAIAVTDPVRNQVVVVRQREATRLDTGETPVAAAWAGERLLVLSRDTARLDAFDRSGARTSVNAGRDAAFLRTSGSSAWVYARGDGLLQRIDTLSMREQARATIAPFASDLETDGATLYLTYPREALIRAYDAATLKPEGETKVGAVPVDAAIAPRGGALTARTIAVADPAAKRVWISEGRQSLAQAFARGFLRGLIGLGLFGNRSREFPSGVDRVTTSGAHTLAFDSSTGTLYSVERKRVKTIVAGIGAGEFVARRDGVTYWKDGELHLMRW